MNQNDHVLIGSQVWTKRNLDVEVYNNGITIPQVTDATDWHKLTSGAWCYYNNDPKYGKLYNWYAATDTQGLAPIGFRIPTKDDWNKLIELLGGLTKATGDKMRGRGWQNYAYGTNECGFNGLPNGTRDALGGFSGSGVSSRYWSTTESSAPALSIALILGIEGVSFADDYSRTNGVSIRCMKDVTDEVVTIGDQQWMTENLNVSTFRNGRPIDEATKFEDWKWACENYEPAWCHYGFDPANGAKYGKLYNRFVMTDPNGIAPYGYHVPSDAEWQKLSDHLGGLYVAGGKLKATGTEFWQSPNEGATNESKFSGLPGGAIADGQFGMMGGWGVWWSTTESTETMGGGALARMMNNTTGHFAPCIGQNDKGYSIRCMKD